MTLSLTLLHSAGSESPAFTIQPALSPPLALNSASRVLCDGSNAVVILQDLA